MNHTTKNDDGKMPKNGFSLERNSRPKHEAEAEIRYCLARIASLTEGIAEFDIALMSAVAIRSIESQQSLTAAAQRLKALLDGQVSA